MNSADDESLQERHERVINEATTDVSFKQWIDGEPTSTHSGETFSPRDPAADVPIVPVARGSEQDVNDAVAAAHQAYDDVWSETSPGERLDYLFEWMDHLRDHSEELARLLSLEVGKPLPHAREEVEDGLEYFEYYAAVARGHEGKHVQTGDDSHAYVRSEPYGVAGQILPWNYPIDLMGWKVGAALAAGNTAVVKPAEQAPLAVTRAAQLSAEVLPDGVLNIVNGLGDEAGAALTNHDGVDKLSFTGSVPVGKSVMHAAAETLSPVTLELGGKNPFIVFPDADIESAAEWAALAGVFNTGQSCDSASRLLIHEDVVEEFTTQYFDEIQSYTVGDPLDEETQVGPLCYADHRDRVADYIDVGVEEGATLRLGGGAPENEALTDGAYFEPTVFDDVSPDMRIAQEEIFGPVQMLMTFSDYEEAIEIANGVAYGLAAGVMTQDTSRAHRAAADIEAGSVWVNQYFGTVPGTPFGGFKDSGIGRECATEAIEEYTQSKSVHLALDDSPP